MRKIILCLILICFMSFSCSESENTSDDLNYNAKVIAQGMDCGNSYLVKFNDDVEGLPDTVSDNMFYEINLPEELKINDLEVLVEYREPTNDEIMSCSTMGTAYAQIYIISAR